jgi:hypothetical protein
MNPLMVLVEQTTGGFGDVYLSGSALFLGAAIVGPLVSAIVWLTKRHIDSQDKTIAEYKQLLERNTVTTERSVQTAEKSIGITESQLVHLLQALRDTPKSGS